MKKLFILAFALNIILMNFLACHASALAGMKLYRNKEYQFSIEVPDYLTYQPPRGPNVKMLAGIKEFSMNIVIRPVPEIESSNDGILAEIHAADIRSSSERNTQILEADIINIPNIRVLYECYVTRYDYPQMTFFLTGYSFQFIKHHRLYCISYFVEPGKENLYKKTIFNSIGSFVDETGWY